MSVDHIGRYEVIEVLGRGAMGVVYLARDPIIDRELAVKTLRVDLDMEFADEFRERFMREARAAGRLNHNGIVTIHDVGEDQKAGTVFIAMEYIEGQDLKDLMASDQLFRPSETARIVASIAEALDYAHSMGVVHRDIKPANIILTKDGTPKIMDFGVARLESSNLTVEGQFIGTPNFMSPEQITGKPVDGRSDIFSLGVLLFNMLTGERPFAGSNIHEVTLKIVQEKCAIPSTIRAGLPPAFNPIILKCLEKEPDKRFQSAAQIAQVLAALARSLINRESGDTGSTHVFTPGLQTQISHPEAKVGTDPQLTLSRVGEDTHPTAETRTFSPNTAAIRRPVVKRPAFSLALALRKLPLPEAAFFEVNPKWVVTSIGSWSGFWLLIFVILLLQIDRGLFVAPSDGRIRSIHEAAQLLRSARQLLERNDLELAEVACRRGLDQAPTSQVGRKMLAEVRRRINSEVSDEATQTRIDDLILQGRGLYREGRYSAAADRFEEVLKFEADNDVASSFLELIEERTRPSSQASASRQTAARAPKRTLTPKRSQRTTAARPTPGQARITLFFNSPISEGTISVSCDGEILTETPFNFTKKTFGIKRKGSGQVKKILLVPSGRHTITVELRAPEIGSMGTQSFTEALRSNSDWTLRLDLAKNSNKANFYFVPSR